jgi:hypothetical protein
MCLGFHPVGAQAGSDSESSEEVEILSPTFGDVSDSSCSEYGSCQLRKFLDLPQMDGAPPTDDAEPASAWPIEG